MTRRFSLISVILGTFFGLASSPAWSAATPNPPGSLCIDNACVTTPLAPTSGSKAIKWHPGLYWQQRPFLSYEPGKTLPSPSACGAEPAVVVGCGPTIYWNAIETNTRGVYDWTMIDRYFKPAKAAGKRFGLNIWAQVVSPGPYYGWPTYALPTYLNESKYCGGNNYSNCGAMPQDYGSTARLWDPDVMDAFADMIEAVCARYNGDSHFEYIMLPETSISNAPAGYTDPTATMSATTTQFGILFERARAACPNTLITSRANWGEQGLLSTLAQKALALKIGIGTTDVTARRVTTMDSLLTGALGGFDYRGKIPIMPASEYASYLSGDCASTTMAYAKNTYKATHVMANDMQASEGASSCQQWSAVKAAVQAQGGFVTACPAGMTCKTD